MQAPKRLRLPALFALLAIAILTPGCNKFKEIEVTSCEISSLTPKGFRSVDAVLSVGVHNPAPSFTLSDVTGCVRNGELTIATFSGGPVSVEKKSDQVYELPCTLMLEEGLSLFEVLNLFKTMDFTGYVVDVSGDVTLSGGLKKKLEYKDIPLDSLVEKGSVRDTFKL